MSIESGEDLKGMRLVGAVVARTLALLRQRVRPGVTTGELDAEADAFMHAEGAQSAPRLQYGFPGATCISVNEEAVHGIPGSRVLRDGDLVTLDVTAELDGFYADAAITVAAGAVLPIASRLCECAEAAFWRAIRSARAGAPLATIGAAVEAEVRRRGFRVIRDLCGHGIGRSIHEPPQVANYATRWDRTRLTRGLVIALEPIISTSSESSRTLRDGWTVVSADGSLTAHYEHTIVVTEHSPMILTAA